jgi:hypothetical protein
MKFNRKVMPLKVASMPYFQTSEVDAKLGPLNVGT